MDFTIDMHMNINDIIKYDCEIVERLDFVNLTTVIETYQNM